MAFPKKTPSIFNKLASVRVRIDKRLYALGKATKASLKHNHNLVIGTSARVRKALNLHNITYFVEPQLRFTDFLRGLERTLIINYCNLSVPKKQELQFKKKKSGQGLDMHLSACPVMPKLKPDQHSFYHFFQKSVKKGPRMRSMAAHEIFPHYVYVIMKSDQYNPVTVAFNASMDKEVYLNTNAEQLVDYFVQKTNAVVDENTTYEIKDMPCSTTLYQMAKAAHSTDSGQPFNFQQRNAYRMCYWQTVLELDIVKVQLIATKDMIESPLKAKRS